MLKTKKNCPKTVGKIKLLPLNGFYPKIFFIQRIKLQKIWDKRKSLVKKIVS